MNTPSGHPGLIGSRDLCDRLGIHRSTLTRWVKAGTITTAGELGGAWLFTEAEAARIEQIHANK